MDAKSLAKSKRAHSQHHKQRPHAIRKPIPQPDGSNKTGNTQKPVGGKQIGEKTRQAQRISALPSNWDRYGEESDLGLEDQSIDGSGQPSDLIIPKSKGADYCYLIAEAQSSNVNSFPSLDDVLADEYAQSLGSMLSVRGEGILSWIGDNNFDVDDGATSSQEVSFLSLNLHAIAKQLEQVDLSELLSIEADLLPTEQCAVQASSTKESTFRETNEEIGAALRTSELDLQHFTDKRKAENGKTQLQSADQLDTSPSISKINSVYEVKNETGTIQVQESNQSRMPNSRSVSELNYVSISDNKLSTLKTTAAEAELDMLLDSLGGTTICDTPVSIGEDTSSYIRKDPTRSQDSSTAAAATLDFDNVLDNLLDQTSSLMKKQNGESEQRDLSGENQTSSSRKSEVLTDFDSWLDTI